MRKKWILPLLLLLFIGIIPGMRAAETSVKTPPLPDALRVIAPQKDDGKAESAEKPAKMVLLDFYSHVCGVCLKMEPHLQELETLVDGAVLINRIDIADEKNKPYLDLYGIDGTPTYILFDAQGQPVYKMENVISSSILKLQVLRHLNRLNKVTSPEAIPSLQDAQASGKVVLVSFQNENCPACAKADPYLSVFESAAQDTLSVVRLNPDEKAPGTLAKTLKVNEEVPFYLIMDASGQELFRYQGEMEPKTLWQVIQTFTESGL